MSQLLHHLALIGYRASGKTSLGMRVAESLCCQWLDLDAWIEETCGRSIATLFADNGEAAFRDIESQSLQAVCERDEALVLSTGGGCVLRSQNRELLRQRCQYVIYLKAPAALLSQRLAADGGDRPSLTGAGISDEVAAVLAEREAFYEECASHVLDATHTIETLNAQILNIVEN